MITVAGIDPCQNQTDGQLNQNFSYDNFSAPNHQTVDNLKPDITPHRPSPKYPQFNSLPARLSTFHQWPLPRPGPPQLAQAGLLYLDKKDQTVCYYCGGGLSSWDPEDDPESEHENWYPHCELVRRRKQQFANTCTKSISVSKQERDPEDPMKSVAVECLRELGYTPENINKALDRVTKQKDMLKEIKNRYGTNVFNAAELMTILDSFDDKEKSDKELSNAVKPNEFEKRPETESCTDSSLSPSSVLSLPSSSQVKYEQVEDNTKLDAKTLIEENQRLRDMTLCKICMDKSSCIVFLPCGHMVCCATCSPAMRKCPICRACARHCESIYGMKIQ